MEKSNTRLLSVDILRGLTIIFMIIVNSPGSWDHVYAPLLHADWNGLTPTDYIFPIFIFIVGVSLVLSITNQREKGMRREQLVKKIVWRSMKIYLIGLFLWLWPSFDFGRIRWKLQVLNKKPVLLDELMDGSVQSTPMRVHSVAG